MRLRSKITLKPNANTFVRWGHPEPLPSDTKNPWPSPSMLHNTSSTMPPVLALPYVFTEEKLGDHLLTASAQLEGKEVKAKERSVRLLKSSPPELWTYTIVNEYPHDSNAYTQGLEFDGEDPL